jgi:hypothetical protein
MAEKSSAAQGAPYLFARFMPILVGRADYNVTLEPIGQRFPDGRHRLVA